MYIIAVKMLMLASNLVDWSLRLLLFDLKFYDMIFFKRLIYLEEGYVLFSPSYVEIIILEWDSLPFKEM